MTSAPVVSKAAPCAVDMHAHWTPPPLARALRGRERIPRIDGAHGRETYHSLYGSRPLISLEMSLDERIGWMGANGIALQMLTLPGLFGVDSLPIQEAAPLVALFNDEAARACREHPQHFLSLAALPLADMNLACEELRRACGLGLRGAVLPVDGFVTLETARYFEPLLDLAAALGCHLFIHPGPMPSEGGRQYAPPAQDSAWLRHIVLGTQARLSEAMVTLNLSGLLDPWPDLTVQVANLGGALPFYVERIEEVCRCQLNDLRPMPPRLRRCFVDTSSFGPRSIAMAVNCFGADRVVFGTDCPIFSGAAMQAALNAAPIGDEARHLVCHGNARRLLKLL